MNPARAKRFRAVLVDLREHYGDLIESWPLLTEAQKAKLLEHSPILQGFIELFGGLT